MNIDFNFICLLMARAICNFLQIGTVAPVAIIKKDEQLMDIIPIVFNDEEEQKELFYELGRKVKEVDANEILIIDEIVMRVVTPKSDEEREQLVSDPTESPLFYPENMRTSAIGIIIHDFKQNKSETYMQMYQKSDEGISFHPQIVKGDDNKMLSFGKLDKLLQSGYTKEEWE